MKYKVITGIMLSLLLISMLTLAFIIQPVRAMPGRIYIRADGSIDPPTANITTVDNVTYTFTDDNYCEGILVERINIIIDGAGHTVQWTPVPGGSPGIDLENRSSVTVKNVKIKGVPVGIWLNKSSSISISGNNITNNDTGFYLWYASNNTLTGNTILNNGHGMYIINSSNNRIYHNNFVNSPVTIISSPFWPPSLGNLWDDGYPSGGNYWSDYNGTDYYSGPYQNLTGSDGIGDTPYVIDANNTDRYPLMHPYVETVVHHAWGEIAKYTTSWNNTDPRFYTLFVSGEMNVTFSSPDANGVINLAMPMESGYIKPVYNQTTNQTTQIVGISDWYGKLYTVNGTGDVDIISMTNDTGTFFWKDGAWHPLGEEWLGDGIPDPAGSAWFTGMLKTSVYWGNGTDGPLISTWSYQLWLTTGFSENTVVEPASRLNGLYVNATGVPFSPPFVGSIGTWVFTRAQLNIPWQGAFLDIQAKMDRLVVTPPAFTVTLYSPANLYVTDPENRHIGTHPITGEHVNEIPGAFYSGTGTHPQRIVIPNPLDGVYDIRIIGTSTGTYTLVVELATLEKITTHTYTGNISVGQILESRVNISASEMTSTSPSTPAPVGGIWIPVNKLDLLAPYIGLTLIIILPLIATAVFVKLKKKKQ